MKNTFKKTLLSTAVAAASVLGLMSTAQADLFTDKQLAVGFQSSGPSVKMPVGEGLKGQLVIGALGTVTAVEARGLKTIGGNETMDFYGFGSVGMWSWDGGRYYGSETAFGAGLGVGLDYDIRNAIPDMPAVFLSAEVGANFVSFDNYNAFDMMSVGLGVHYQF